MAWYIQNPNLDGMTFFRLLGYLGLLTLIISCNTNPSNYTYETVSKNRILMKKFENGKLVKEMNALVSGHDTLLDGAFREFYSNALLRCTGANKMGKHIGYMTFYDSAGHVSAVDYYDETGNIHGLQKKFDKSGRLIRIFFSQDNKGDMFSLSYKPNGSIDTFAGVPMNVYVYSETDHMHVGDTLKVEHELIRINRVKQTLKATIYNSHSIVFDTTLTESDSLGSTFFFPLIRRLDFKGQFTYKAVIQISDSISGNVLGTFTKDFPLRIVN